MGTHAARRSFKAGTVQKPAGLEQQIAPMTNAGNHLKDGRARVGLSMFVKQTALAQQQGGNHHDLAAVMLSSFGGGATEGATFPPVAQSNKPVGPWLISLKR